MRFRKVFRISDSLAITIPSDYAKALGIKEGDYVVLLIYTDGIYIKKIR